MQRFFLSGLLNDRLHFIPPLAALPRLMYCLSQSYGRVETPGFGLGGGTVMARFVKLLFFPGDLLLKGSVVV